MCLNYSGGVAGFKYQYRKVKVVNLGSKYLFCLLSDAIKKMEKSNFDGCLIPFGICRPLFDDGIMSYLERDTIKTETD